MSICSLKVLLSAQIVIVLFIGLASAAEPSLDVMTMNLWHKNRPDELRAVARYLRSDLDRVPDFILCQEVVFHRTEDDLPTDTAKFLAWQLNFHSKGTQRKSDKEGVAIISRHPFLFYDELHLRAQTSRLLLGFNRVSVMGEFFVPKIGRVRVVNVHFTNWKFEHRIRGKQLAETMQWIADRQAKVQCTVTFFGGDFNAKRHWDEMKPLDGLDGEGSLLFDDFNTSAPTMGSPGNPNKRIDYIFIAGGRMDFAWERILFQERLSDGVSDFYLSDHVALLHRYKLKSADVPIADAAAK